MSPHFAAAAARQFWLKPLPPTCPTPTFVRALGVPNFSFNIFYVFLSKPETQTPNSSYPNLSLAASAIRDSTLFIVSQHRFVHWEHELIPSLTAAGPITRYRNAALRCSHTLPTSIDLIVDPTRAVR
eukprot:970700-Prorocentrum_minimum.AAC.4